MLELVSTGLVYRNPKPHLRSIHAWHPSIVLLDDGTLVAGFDLGEAVESLDYRTYTARSVDNGSTWSEPKPLFDDDTARRCTHTARLGRTRDGLIVALGGRFFRDNPEEGLVNRENLGYVPMELIQLTSSDGGHIWTPPKVIRTPLVGPGFEICHRLVELSDGTWLLPTSTWKGWNGEAPHGMQAIALVSRDRGASWPEWMPIADQYERGVISWEQGLTELPDGRLLVVVWSFNERTGHSEPSRYTLTNDERQFRPLRLNEVQGETAKLLTLRDGRVLMVYRRIDQPGLWANLVTIEDDQWMNHESIPLWRGTASWMSGERNSTDELSGLKFGFPSLVQLPDGDVLVVFWCREECIHNIRWLRVRTA